VVWQVWPGVQPGRYIDAVNATRPYRRPLRMPLFDYASSGAYFITICIREKECVLGDVVNNQVRLTEIGELVGNAWRALTDRFPTIRLDAFVIMPNHVHAIL
jgi:hypothetical protein